MCVLLATQRKRRRSSSPFYQTFRPLLSLNQFSLANFSSIFALKILCYQCKLNMLDSVHDISYRCCHSLVTTHPPSNTKILMHSCAKILLQICILCNLCRIYFYLLFMPLSFEWGYYYWLYNHPNWIEGHKRCANSTADLPGAQGVLMQ